MKHYKTIVVSDIHLGAEESKAKEIVRFLKNILATGLYLMAISLMAGKIGRYWLHPITLDK